MLESRVLSRKEIMNSVEDEGRFSAVMEVSAGLPENAVGSVSALDLAWDDDFQFRLVWIPPNLMACAALPMLVPPRFS